MDNRDLDKMETLIIDVLLLLSATLNNENSKTFFNLLGLMKKAEKIATTFTNRSFSYFLFNIEKV